MSLYKAIRKYIIENKIHAFKYKFIFYIYFMTFVPLFYSEQSLDKIIVFNPDSHYRAGNFAINKNNDMIIEYSYQNKRLFYGLKQNGRYFFNDENGNPISTKEITLQNNEDTSITQRYESKNIFVSLKNDVQKDKEYLFSTSSYTTVSELYDLENLENIHNKVKTTSRFLGTEIFGFQFSLLELPSNTEKQYVLIYSTSTTSDPGQYITLKKFTFTEFNFVNYETSEKEINNFFNRLASAFILNDSLIILFHIDNAHFKIKVFNFNLDKLADIGTNIFQETTNYNNDKNKGRGLGYYLKCIHLKDNIGVFSFYIYNNYHYPEIIVGKIEPVDNDQKYTFNSLFRKNFDNNYYYLQAEYLLNDIIKINDNRYCFISSSDGRQQLYIYLFDLYNEDKNMKLRIFKSNINDYKMVKEFSSVIFNGYLVFTSTVIDKNQNNYFNDDICNSILMIFGYPNAIDNEIDISLFLMDMENYNNENNLYNTLMENMNIENNIFGYEKVDKIKIISYPEDILFYKEENILLTNGDFIEDNYKIYQNTNTIKNNNYYSIEYQYMVKEAEYNKFDTYAIKTQVFTLSGSTIEDQSNYYTQNTFYGRIITLKFKLCYELCKTCSSLGISIDNQKCISCIDNYVNDHLKPTNCIPEGYYNNGDSLIQCTEGNSKFYFNEFEKKICFNSDLECPEAFSDFDPITNECKKTKIITTLPTTHLNIKTSTIKTTYITINIKTTFLNNILTTIPTTNLKQLTTNIKTTYINNIRTTIPSTYIKQLTTNIKTSFISVISTTIPTYIKTTYINIISNNIQTTNIKQLTTNIRTTILNDISSTILKPMTTFLKSSLISSYPNIDKSKIHTTSIELTTPIDNSNRNCS